MIVSKTLSSIILGVLFIVSCTSCAELVSLQTSSGIGTDTTQALTESDVVSGLKAALEKGATYASNKGSEEDGYFGNSLIKIPFPPDAAKAEQKLRQIGLGKEVDKFILSLNRGAEAAATKAAPIFVSAVRSMTIEDAWGILRGEDDAATQYLMRTTSPQLKSEFTPVISDALDQVNATKYYSDLITTYNKIPFVTKVDPDLDNYATDLAIKGLFVMVAEEEGKIREDPLERTSDILRRVFGNKE
jgi:hypothetical protein